MALFTIPYTFAEDLANKIHDLNSDSFRWVLSNSASVATSTFLLSNVTQIATGGGYTQMTDGAGGLPVTLSYSRSANTTTVSGTQVVFTATGAVGPFQYLTLINDTPTAGGGAASPGANPVIGWLNHGSAVTMANSDTYTIPAAAYFFIQ